MPQGPDARPEKSKLAKPEIVAGEILDSCIFEGNVHKAAMYEMPRALEAAFKRSQGPIKETPPYAYDRSKFEVFFETTELEDGTWEDAGVVAIQKFGDVAAITSEGGMQYKIELSNSRDGIYPVTKDEMLKAIHAAKLELV